MTDFRAEREINCRVNCIRDHLDAIEKLLPEQEPEPECLATSVLRLTELCNRLEKENQELKRLIKALNKDLSQWSNENRKLKKDLNQNAWDFVALKRDLAYKTRKLARVAEALKMEQTKS